MSGKISAQMVMDLRRRTGVGMSKCKEALQEAEGDVEEAVYILRKRGMATAVNKGTRKADEGVIGHAENERGFCLVEVSAETDFVIQNDRFKKFLKYLCVEALRTQPESVQKFLKQKCSHDPALSVDEHRAEIVHSLGENIQVKNILNCERGDGQSLGIYSHGGGKIVSIVLMQGSDNYDHLAREVAMHVAAEKPDFVNPEDVPPEVLEVEEEIARSQVHGKPPEVIDKIVQGKREAFFEQKCLMKQKYVKKPSMSVGEFIAWEGKKANKDLSVVKFIRWQIGG